MPAKPSGYSGTPLAKKLGLKDDMRVLLHGNPKDYTAYFADFPKDITFLKRATSESADFIHVFCTEFSDLETAFKRLKPALRKDGLMWISWPKGASKIKTDIKREPLRSYILPSGLVDTKVCAVDEDWSGLKFVYRLKDR